MSPELIAIMNLSLVGIFVFKKYLQIRFIENIQAIL